MAKTSADFFYLAANVANSDRPEYAQHFRDAGHALGWVACPKNYAAASVPATDLSDPTTKGS
jgi:hypothetical protein